MSEARPSVALPDPGFGGECVISRRDLEVLIRGAESEREIGYRNLSAGVAASCGLGTLSTIVSHFGEWSSIGANPVESLLLILLIATTLAAGALAVFFHRRLQAAASPGGCRPFDQYLRTRLGEVAELEDPRRWP